MAIYSTISLLLLSLLFVAFAFLSSAAIDGGCEAERVAEAAETNPYYFNRSSFQTMFSSKDGIVTLLPKFTDRSPKLFRGIENPRFYVLETAPRTFVMPHHSDADALFVILRGRGIIKLLSQETKDIFNVKQGDVVRLASAVIRYVYNTDANQRLQIAILFFPVNNPGLFDNFFLPGLDGQDSYLRGFSNGVLTSSLNVSIELIDEVLRQQQGVAIIRPIPVGQIDDLSQPDATYVGQESSGSGSFNILSQEPIYSNEFGKFYEAAPEKFELLQDLDASVTLVNMTQGSIFVPHFSSKATMIVFIDSGCGRFEMVAFNTSGAVTWYVSDVCEGEVYVIPAGHPVAVVSLVANDQNFVALGFGINAQNNSRNFLAGQENVVRKLENKALRLTFGVEPEVAEKAFTSQNGSYFVGAVPIRQECFWTS